MVNITARLRRIATQNGPGALPTKLRRRRFRWFEELVLRVRREHDRPIRVVDFGGTAQYWHQVYDVAANPLGLEVTLLNMEFQGSPDPWFEYVTGDVTDMSSFSDKHFDLGYSNSLIEHVGSVPQQMKAAAEMQRVSRYLCIQTPNFWFPWEPHYNLPFVHWLPLPPRIRLLSLVHRRTFAAEVNAYRSNPINLMSGSILRTVFPLQTYVHHRETLVGLTKSFVVCSRLPGKRRL